MNKIATQIVFCLLLSAPVMGQGPDNQDTTGRDSLHTHPLNEVLIRAFEENRSLLETPAALNTLGKKQLERFDNANILPAMNTTPGVRMEERSPGSYRLSIRGSSLRSPFGVRNVKVYYNDIPYTDPGGNTYLNLLGYYNFQSLEIIKGPGSSLYGAGTGGVLLINSYPREWQPGTTASYTGGSYNLRNAMGELRLGDSNFQNIIRYQHLRSDGYRVHSSLRRDVASWDAKLRTGQTSELAAHFLYGDLYYQTPGALTLPEYEADPQAARPAVGYIPGAEAKNAAIHEKTFLAGFTYKQQFGDHWQNTTTLYGLYAQLHNPAIANYARSTEPNLGGRTTIKYETAIGSSKLQWLLGAEGQQGYTTVRTYQNLNGNPDTLQTEDEINSRLVFGFTQLSWQLHRLVIAAGLSVSQLHITTARFTTPPYSERVRNFNNQLSPRLAILYKVSDDLSVYATAARGYSPPTTAELSPSGGPVNLDLNPEEGWNYEIGWRGRLLDNRLYFDLSGFYFRLQNTIVQRRDPVGGSYFVNSGSTEQMGLEATVNYELLGGAGLFGPCNVWISYSGYHFTYKDFMQVDKDYSGNKLPSVAPMTLAAGVDLATRPGFYTNVTYYYSDKIALNDANSAYANAYHLLSARLGYRHTINRFPLDIYVGGNNLLDQKYSLGNDINGFGGRYYNAAPRMNFFAGISMGYNRRGRNG